MTTITITNEHGTYSVSGDALGSEDYLRLFIAVMIAASFEYETITDSIIELADKLNE